MIVKDLLKIGDFVGKTVFFKKGKVISQSLMEYSEKCQILFFTIKEHSLRSLSYSGASPYYNNRQ